MGSKTSKAKSSRNAQRAANTEKLMSNIMAPGAGEISKKREAELQAAANYGRGVQFKPGSPYVGGSNVFRIDPATGEKKRVMRTGTTGADFTGSIIANKPTTGEFFGDIGRGLFGGQAQSPSYISSPTTLPGTPTTTSRQFTPTPERTTGILPPLAEKLLVPGGITLGIAKDLFQRFFPGQEENDTQPIVDLRKPTIDERVSTFVEQVGTGDQKRETLKSLIEVSEAPGAAELDVDTMSDQEVDLRLQAYGQGFAMGGLTDTIPPNRGPMSEGVASLFKNK